jgi:hypothetical protein
VCDSGVDPSESFISRSAKAIPKMNRYQALSSKSLILIGTVASSLLTATGCQVSLNGQTLPSPYYLQDDVQYFPSGPEFKLPREAAALRAAEAENKLKNR